MKSFFTITPSLWISKTARILAGGAMLATLTACSSTGSLFRTADSSLPIEVQHLGGGQIMSFRAHETSDRLYVAGSARKHKLSNSAHVDIQLIGPSGNVIAEDQDDINPTHSAPGGGKRFTDSYVVSFPLSQARQAVKIRVTYHSSSHSEGNS
jgi:hypothetical protein